MPHVRTLAFMNPEPNVPAPPANPVDRLCEQARHGDEAALQAYLDAGGDPSARHTDGTPLLHAFVRAAHLGGAARLVLAGADPDATDADQETALHAAAERGHYALLQLLLNAGANCLLVDRHGWRARQRVATDGTDGDRACWRLLWAHEHSQQMQRRLDNGLAPAGTAKRLRM